MGIFNRLKQALMIIITTNNNDEIVHSPNSYENDKSDLNRNIALSSPVFDLEGAVFDLEGVQMTITQVKCKQKNHYSWNCLASHQQ